MGVSHLVPFHLTTETEHIMNASLQPRQDLQIRQMLSQHMLQALHVLQMDLHALYEAIARETEENPLVELPEAWKPSAPLEDFIDKLAASTRTSLTEDLLFQLREVERDPVSLRVGAQIVAGLDDRGYLVESLGAIAQAARVSVDEVKRVLRILRGFEPVGVTARSLRECLLIQLRASGSPNPCAMRIVRDHLRDLSQNRIDRIASATGHSLDEVREAAAIIRSLNPRPAEAYRNPPAPPALPDVRFAVVECGIVAALINQPPLPRVCTSSQDYLRNANGELRAFARAQLSRAQTLRNCVELRASTLLRVAACVAERQTSFFTDGAAPAPLTLVEVGEALELHPSTISRAIMGRYFQFGERVYAFKLLFPARVQGDTSNARVKRLLREWIAAEDKRKPLSDSAIAQQLAALDIAVSRRAIAKYRSALGIPGTAERRIR